MIDALLTLAALALTGLVILAGMVGLIWLLVDVLGRFVDWIDWP